jgi:predicted amidohydrolase
MLPELKVGMVSAPYETGDVKKGLAKAVVLVKKAAQAGANLVFFPEMYLGGYLAGREPGQQYMVSEKIPGPSTKVLIDAARANNVYIIMGMTEADSDCIGALYNSAVFVGPEGLLGVHRKIVIEDTGIFELGHWGYGHGRNTNVWQTKYGWRVGIAICYDNWMPEIPRALTLKGADLIVAISACDKAGGDAFSRLVPIRALENQVCYAWTSPAGKEYELEYPGATLAVNPFGIEIAREQNPEHGVITIASFKAQDIYEMRHVMPLLRDRMPLAWQIVSDPNAVPTAPWRSNSNT